MSAEINNLPEQNLEKLDVTKLDPFDIEVMSHQATINIGTIGHVAHGKSTVVRAISGIQTVRFKSELERNITIKLGYANAKIFKCDNAKCLRPDCYKSFKSSMNNMKPACDQCNSTMTLQRHVSFVDCFGLDEEFLTTDGQVISNKDITIGTSLMGPDGCARIVEDITEGVKDMYKISYATKEGGFNCTGGHLLCLRVDEPCDATYFSNTANRYIVRYIKGNENEVTSHVTSFATIEEADDFYQTLDKSPLYVRLTVDAYLKMSQMFKYKARMYSAPVLPFDNHARTSLAIGDASEEEVAWVVGLWLGSGSVGVPKFILSSADDEIIEKLTNITMKMGASVNSSQSKDQSAMFVTLNNISGENVFMQLLKKLGIVDNKRICDAIKFHSVEVRRALVAGFFDADGSLNNGQFSLEQSVTVQDQLFNDFIFVVRSLGFAANVNTHKTHITSINQDGDKIITPCNKLRVRFNADNTLPIASSHKRGTNSLRSSVTSQTFSVESLGDMPYKGFKVSGADQKVLLKDFLVVHNCPGHDILMATMLNGAAVMDAAFLLIAGNESCPQPQTSEHLAAVEIMKLKNIVILQNKIDLVMEREAASQYEEILNFVRGTVADGAPIIPISAQLRYNIEVILEYICTKIPKPIRDFTSSPRMIVIRSFDVNLPGEEVENLKGGVAGGSILRGVLRMGQEIEVRPGIVTRDAEGRVKCIPIFSKINSLFAEKNSLNYAVPGGLIGVGTKIDPTLTRADRLVGQVLGQVGELPEIFTELEISFFLLRRLLGVVADKAATNKKADRITKLIRGEVLMVNIGSTSTGARVLSVKGDLAKVVLTSPVCSSEGEKLALSRRVDKHWRLIGWGMIQKGRTIDEVDADEVEVEEN